MMKCENFAIGPTFLQRIEANSMEVNILFTIKSLLEQYLTQEKSENSEIKNIHVFVSHFFNLDFVQFAEVSSVKFAVFRPSLRENFSSQRSNFFYSFQFSCSFYFHFVVQ